MTDVELLEQHRGGSDSAFADLVRRHLGWVYGVARRRLRDAHLAEDVAQAVFVLLDRKAPRFPADAAMVSWLHKTAWYATESAARNERRRQKRETQAAELQSRARESEPACGDEPDWQHLAPLLDDLIGQLSRSDREAVLLRYYRDLSYAQVGEQTGTTADAARKRVERAIEKLRKLAEGRGLTMSSVSLAGSLAAHVRIVPPPGLVATATVSATAGAGSSMAASSGAIVKGAVWSMAVTKLAVAGIIAAALALIATGGAIAWHFAPLNTGGESVAASVPVANPVAAVTVAPTGRTPVAAAAPPADQRSPFSDIRWRGQTAQVQVNDAWYEWVSINDIPAQEVVTFARQMVGDTWPQRIAVELPALLDGMGHPAGATVKLGVKTLDTGQLLTLADVLMTAENARLISPQSGGVAAFSAVRWRGDTPQVEIQNRWYELLAVDQTPVNQLAAFAKTTYGLGTNALGEVWWRKRITEDLPSVLTAMGRAPGHSVSLQLRDLDDGRQLAMANVAMTPGNRESILNHEGKTDLP